MMRGYRIATTAPERCPEGNCNLPPELRRLLCRTFHDECLSEADKTKPATAEVVAGSIRIATS